ncbi:uncharacterized protein I303_101409 [Kwoniella dejecticola CBS 10117]|uniref:Uncharacterized protein n=1 Tax=Kwoniella dejecticola CBS 10117 TaxID=1296121 RepID=A0A1A6AHP6_9TREE|nr:uncharacterized protein I303_01418 [Kwoniella dejecticola CBS 10117]OBR89589.1 hypothetical protein I303_01418 [Kwoniella dejecticola CBS 10117]
MQSLDSSAYLGDEGRLRLLANSDEVYESKNQWRRAQATASYPDNPVMQEVQYEKLKYSPEYLGQDDAWERCTNAPSFHDPGIKSKLNNIEMGEISRQAKRLCESMIQSLMTGDCTLKTRYEDKPADMDDMTWLQGYQADCQKFKSTLSKIDWAGIYDEDDEDDEEREGTFVAALKDRIGTTLPQVIERRKENGRNGFISLDQIGTRVLMDPQAVTQEGKLEDHWATLYLSGRYGVLETGIGDDLEVCKVGDILDVNEPVTVQVIDDEDWPSDF